VFDPSCFGGTVFPRFPVINVSVLRADIKVLHLKTAGSFFAPARVIDEARWRWKGLAAWERKKEAFLMQMSNHDPSFDGLKSSGFDPSALFRRLDGDIELLRDLLQIFSEESPILLKKIGAAIQHGSFEDVRKLSHKLKGSALQFSGSRMAFLAASLEQMGTRQSLDGAAGVFSDLEQEVANLQRSLQSLAEGKGWTS